MLAPFIPSAPALVRALATSSWTIEILSYLICVLWFLPCPIRLAHRGQIHLLRHSSEDVTLLLKLSTAPYCLLNKVQIPGLVIKSFTFWSQFIFITLLPTTRLHTLHALVKPSYSFAESLAFDSSRLCSWFLKCSFLLSAQVLLAFQGPNSASPLLVKPPVSPSLNYSNTKSVLLSESTSLFSMASSEEGTYLRPAAGLKLL